MSAPAEDVITVSGPVTDQRRALAFNAGTLEFKLAGAGETMPGIRRVQVTANGTTRLRLFTWWEPMPPGRLATWPCAAATWPPTTNGWSPRGWSSTGRPSPGQTVWYHPHGNALVLQSDNTGTMMTRSRPQARPSYDAV